MSADSLKRHFVDAMAKHLPPSASNLQLIDIDGHAGEFLSQRREDLQITIVEQSNMIDTPLPDDSLDAVVAYNIDLSTPLLNRVLNLMRAGGRFIVVLSKGDVSAEYVELLENHGYVRILVESAVDDLGVLIRGEKAHQTDDTITRIQQVATSDDDKLDLSTFRGRYIHLLIQQTPNKPVWKLQPDEKIHWRAVAVDQDEQDIVLGFTSLPKAVGFMQPAVVDGVIRDINKVGKFTKETIMAWDDDRGLVLNPTLDDIRRLSLTWVDIDPDTAEAPDE